MTTYNIDPTPVYNLAKLQANSTNWQAGINDAFNGNMDKLETAIQEGGGGSTMLFKHAIMMRSTAVKFTCDIISAISSEFEFDTFCQYLNDIGCVSVNAPQSAVGFSLVAGNPACVYGISSPDGATLNVHVIADGSESTLDNQTPDMFVDTTVKIQDH